MTILEPNGACGTSQPARPRIAGSQAATGQITNLEPTNAEPKQRSLPQTLAWTLPISIASESDSNPLSCNVTVWRPASAHDCHAVVLYLHGGGLLYGQRDDLPNRYVQLVRSHGYSLVCMDYPLAPQAQVGTILAAVEALWQRCESELFEPLGTERAFICGRSAGGYLALMLAHRLQAKGEPADTPGPNGQSEEAGPAHATIPIAGVMDFYGYCDLPGTMAAALWQPSLYYRRNVPIITPRMARRLAGTSMLTSASLEKRFALYAYARQTGRWGELLGITRENAAEWSLDAAAQHELPPLFIAASTTDADVPFAASEQLARNAADATTFFVHNLEHDFDRDPTHPEGMQAWEACLAWADTR